MKRVRTDDPPSAVQRRSKRLASRVTISDLADLTVLPHDICRHILAFACRGLVDIALFRAQYGYDFRHAAGYQHVPRCAFVSNVRAVANSMQRYADVKGASNWARLTFSSPDVPAKAVFTVSLHPERFYGEMWLRDVPNSVDIIRQLMGVIKRSGGASDVRRCRKRASGRGFGFYGVPIAQLQFTIAVMSTAVGRKFKTLKTTT